MDNDKILHGKGFHDYVQRIREEKLRKEIEHEFQLLDLSIQLDDARKDKIRAEMERDRNVKILEREVLKEVLNRDTPVKKLTKKEQTEQRAKEISDLKRLEIVAKHRKK